MMMVAMTMATNATRTATMAAYAERERGGGLDRQQRRFQACGGLEVPHEASADPTGSTPPRHPPARRRRRRRHRIASAKQSTRAPASETPKAAAGGDGGGRGLTP